MRIVELTIVLQLPATVVHRATDDAQLELILEDTTRVDAPARVVQRHVESVSTGAALLQPFTWRAQLDDENARYNLRVVVRFHLDADLRRSDLLSTRALPVVPGQQTILVPLSFVT